MVAKLQGDISPKLQGDESASPSSREITTHGFLGTSASKFEA